MLEDLGPATRAPPWQRDSCRVATSLLVARSLKTSPRQLSGAKLAEGEGFEPPEPFRVQWFSRPPPSTTRPSLPPTQAYITVLASAWLARAPKGATAAASKSDRNSRVSLRFVVHPRLVSPMCSPRRVTASSDYSVSRGRGGSQVRVLTSNPKLPTSSATDIKYAGRRWREMAQDNLPRPDPFEAAERRRQPLLFVSLAVVFENL